MKKVNSLFLIFILTLSFHINAQEKRIFDEGATLDEATQKLVMALQELDKVEQLQKLINLRFKTEFVDNEFVESNSDLSDNVKIDMVSSPEKKWKDLSDSEFREDLISKFSKLKFYQYYDEYPKSSFTIGDPYLGDFDNYKPEYIIRKIYFADGSIVDIDGNLSVDDFEMTHAKPVDSIKVELAYKYPSKYKSIMLTADNPNYEDGNSFAYLTSLKGRDAEVTISNDIYTADLDVEGIDKDGDFISSSSSTKLKLPSDETMRYLLEVKMVIESLLREFDTYETVEELETEFSERLNTEDVYKLENHKVDYHASFFFKKNVSGLRINYSQGLDSIQQEFIVKSENPIDLYKIIEIQTSNNNDREDDDVQYMIIDKYGDVVIPSISAGFKHVKGTYFSYADKDYTHSLYRLDVNKKKLILCPFGLGSIYVCSNDNGVINIEDDNGNTGVADMDGNIIIPMKYYSIYNCQYKDYIITLGKDSHQLKGLFTKEGKQILPERYSNIEIKGNCIYASEIVDGRYIRHEYAADSY